MGSGGEEAMSIDPQFVVNLKGKSYPMYAGVLDAATKAGLKSLTTTLVQLIPVDRGYMAVVQARAEFEDGRVFEDLGDASPFNCSPQIATAAIRMASTRAKGRVLRDALNIGQTLLEELPDEETNGHGERGNGNGAERHAGAAARPPAQSRREAAAPAQAGGAAAGAGVGEAAVVCEEDGCGIQLTKNQVAMSQHHAKRRYCRAHMLAHTEPAKK
jgi:hypothetical protein